MFLICSAPSLCCRSKLILKVIREANGDKVYKLGFLLYNRGDKLGLDDRLHFDIVQLWIGEIVNSHPIAKGGVHTAC